MRNIKRFILCALAACSVFGAPSAQAKTVEIGVLGMGGGAFDAMKKAEQELDVKMSFITAASFRAETLPDLSKFDAILVSFSNAELKDQYRAAFTAAKTANPAQKVFCVGPPQLYGMWSDWIGKQLIQTDAVLSKYYGLSDKSMQDMVKYILINHFDLPGEVDEPGAGEVVEIFHPDYGNLESLDAFLTQSQSNGWNTAECPRVALGSYRHHVLFHQPKVIEALIREFEKQGVLAVCLVADDPKFTERLKAFKPNLVVMTSHTREPAKFWENFGVPRIHALWFTDPSIDEWKTSETKGMSKSSIQHQIISSEFRGATECLTSGGTRSGGNSGEEILPIPDRIERIVGRAKGWIALQEKKNADKKVALMVYDHESDKSRLMCGAHHALNAPRSMIKFLNSMKQAGYSVGDIPADETELLELLSDHGRQMGSWEKGNLDKLAKSGHAVLVPEEDYLKWFNEKVPAIQQAAMRKNWGEAPGEYMVWESKGKKFLVLPKLDFGEIVMMTQPPKGETLLDGEVGGGDESLMPPTHHFLATYFWLQESYKPDALIHFGSHGNEWLFPGKMATLSRGDWTDMTLENIPNINPWLANNTAEVLSCKRRAHAVTVDFLPPVLMYADLSDELLNLESTIDKYLALEVSVLQKKFAASITELVKTCHLEQEVELPSLADGLLTEQDIAKVSLYLHDLKNEMIPANMHVLGEQPPEELMVPYLLHCMGKRYLTALAPLLKLDSDDDDLRLQGESILRLVLEQGFTAKEAVEASGADLAGIDFPEIIEECLNLAVEMNVSLRDTHAEIDGVLDALDGKFIAPGPSGDPERNPSVAPTGRNMYVLNPAELPAKSSWELAVQLTDDYLKSELDKKGRYPRKVAFCLVPYATYSDFGIIESQILYLMGMRPVWDLKNRVKGVEVIPAKELGRPRIDVFLSARSVYRDELPSLMRLLDRAIRTVATLDEPDNLVFANSQHILAELMKQGFSAEKAKTLSMARMYGTKPEEVIDGHDWFFYLTDRTGEWENRDDLLDVYLRYCKHAYTKGFWGIDAPEAFDLAIQDTDLILKSWYDRRDFVLGNKFAWWAEGTLSLAIKHLTGKEPDYMFVDVRDPDEASIIDSSLVVQRDFRARVSNPKWIKQMIKEGYAGASIINQNVNNMLGWEIMREQAVSDSDWEELVEIYVRDRENLNIRDWFDSKNPHAFQKLTATMIETVRKEYWAADEATQQELAVAYAESVIKHGASSGIRAAGNEKLEQFVGKTLLHAGLPDLQKAYEAKVREAAEARMSEQVAGNKMERVDNQKAESGQPAEPELPMSWIIIGAVLLMVGGGFIFRKSFPLTGGVE